MTELPAVDGIITARELAATIDAIEAIQLPDGNIPWTPGGHTDPWNLVEAAMALDIGGRHEAARAAYDWLAGMQRDHGGWHAYYLGNTVEDSTLDTNVTCYIATGAWHHHLTTGDTAYLRRQWPVVEAAIDFALDHQRETGEIAWRADDPDDGAPHRLLEHPPQPALRDRDRRAPRARAPRLGDLARALAVAIAHRPDVFLDKDRWAMDWYYPILGGVLRGDPAHARIASRWPTFAVDGRGVRCVSDRPWITAAETCELVMALDALGVDAEARMLFEWVQFLRSETGGYWTGSNFDNDAFHAEGELYPAEQPSWNSAAVVLAANALAGTGPTAGLFRGERLPDGLSTEALLAAGVEIEHERAARKGTSSSPS